MNNRKKILILILLILIIAGLLSIMLSCKIDYYENIHYEIDNKRVYVKLDKEPNLVYINVERHVYKIDQWIHVSKDIYLLDFFIQKQDSEKMSAYINTYKLNYLSYILKIVFNI